MNHLRALGAVILLLAFAVSGALADSHLSSDPRVKAARALAESGRFAEALDILRPLVSGHADRTDVLFLFGLAAIGAAERVAAEARDALLDEAVAALRAILIDHPGLARVRLELARAFFIKGVDRLAREHFERVLAGRPPPAVVANIRRFLAAIRARRRWSGYFGLAVAPDTNINGASGEDIVYLWGLPFGLDDPLEAESGVGLSLWGGGEYQHPLAERLRLRAGADAFRTEYRGHDFDRMTAAVHVGPRFLSDRNTEFSLLAVVRRDWRAGKPESRSHGLRAEGERRIGRRLSVSGRAGWRRRGYRRDEHQSLNGPRSDVSLHTTYRLTPTLRADLMGGLAWERPEQAPAHHSDAHWVRVGFSAVLPWGFTAGISGEWRRTSYAGNPDRIPTLDAEARTDRLRFLRITIFNRAFTVFGFSPQLALTRERRETNAQLAGYERHRAEFRFARQF